VREARCSAICFKRSAIAMLFTAAMRSTVASLTSETMPRSTGSARARLVESWRIEISFASFCEISA
jgi:hypothetical protein